MITPLVARFENDAPGHSEIAPYSKSTMKLSHLTAGNYLQFLSRCSMKYNLIAKFFREARKEDSRVDVKKTC